MNTTIDQIVTIERVKGHKKRYEVNISGQRLVLDFPTRYKMNANFTIGSKSFSIKRTGWWKRFINIEANQSPYTKWSIPQSWSGGEEIRYEDNRVYKLKKSGIFSCKWHWFNERGEPVIEYAENQWSFHPKARVSILIEPNETSLWLVAVGWFIMLCRRQDSAAAAAAS